MSKKSNLTGLSAELKSAKAEARAERARLRKQLQEARAWGRQQQAAMAQLIKEGKVPSSVNKTDNNQNRNRNPKPKQGPTAPTKAESRVQAVRSKVKAYKSGKGGGSMYSPSKPLKDQSLLSMAKKRQM